MSETSNLKNNIKMKYLTLKQIVLMLVAFLSVVSIQAQTADYMNVYLSSQGSFQSINIDEIDKITFPSEDEVNIVISGVVTPMAIDNIEFITFGDTNITAIEDNEAEVAEIEITHLRGSGEVRIKSPEAINLVQFYNMQGVLMQSLTPGVETATFDVSGYPNGIYIVAVQSNGKTVTKKIIK